MPWRKNNGRKYYISRSELAERRKNSGRQDQESTKTGPLLQSEGAIPTIDRVSEELLKEPRVSTDIPDKGNPDVKARSKLSKTTKQKKTEKIEEI